MLKNNFYRPVVLRKVVHLLLDIFLNFVIFCILFCILQIYFIIATTRQTLSKFYFRHFNYFNHCFVDFWSRSFLTSCSLFLSSCSFFLSFSPFFLPPPMHNAQSTKQRNCALALSKKSKSSWVTKQELLVIVLEIAISL